MHDVPSRSGMPENAECVFKGVIFEVWQWEQVLFDGTTELFEKIWRVPTAEVIATVGDKILIEEQDQPGHLGFLSLPSGRVEEGESVLIAAKRELLEETGYTSSEWSIFKEHKATGKVLHSVYYFIARNCSKVADQQLDAGERITVSEISYDELLALAGNPRFWAEPYFINLLLRAKIDKNVYIDLQQQIFGSIK